MGFVVLKAKIDGFKDWDKMRMKSKVIQKQGKKWEEIEKHIILKWRVKKPKFK